MHSVSGLNSPGTEVPSATNTTAVTESLRPTVQPKCEARSPVTTSQCVNNQDEAYKLKLGSHKRTDDGGEQSNHADGHNKAGPAVPVLCGRDEGEEDLPEDSEEVHDIVKTRRELLFSALVVVIVLT